MSEMPECYIMTVRKARKDHKCCECGGVIKTGEKYNYHSGIWGGDPQSFKVCVDCDDLRKTVIDDCGLRYDEAPAFRCLGYDVEGEHHDLFMAIKEKRRQVIEEPKP